MNFGNHKRERGQIGEKLAEEFLRTQLGWRILARNWSCRRGEIDIVAEDAGTIVFVEVKARDQETVFDPESAVDLMKRNRIREAARAYLNRWTAHSPYRYDVVAVWLTGNSDAARIELRQDAFTDELRESKK